jgi:uncharacterized damage-inducible protein DinB
MNSTCSHWITEIEREARATAALLALLPQERLAWRPHPKSHTLGQLAWHIASLNGSVVSMLGVDTLDAATVNFSTPQPATVAEVRACHEQALVTAREALGRWSEADLAREWRLVHGDKVLMAAPRGDLARSILLNHLYHHRGQLTVYLRLLDLPLPSVYGPSADFNPLAG